MAYFNGFPATYQPMVYQQPQNQQSSIIWVSGEAGAKAYMVAPNSTVQLWDSESQTIYLKSADASGMPSFKILDYTIREAKNQPNNAPLGADDKLHTYATKDDLRAISDRLAALSDRVEKMEVKDDE